MAGEALEGLEGAERLEGEFEATPEEGVLVLVYADGVRRLSQLRGDGSCGERQKQQEQGGEE
jgi:hypothetical protein